MSITIAIGELTTCEVIENGRFLRLGAKDRFESPVSIEVSFEQAQGILMTLPHLLRKALHSRTGNPSFRFAFPLGRWTVEQALDHECLIITLNTDDGFDVAFSLPFDTSRAIALVLREEAAAAENRASEAANEQSASEIHLH